MDQFAADPRSLRFRWKPPQGAAAAWDLRRREEDISQSTKVNPYTLNGAPVLSQRFIRGFVALLDQTVSKL